MDTQNVINSIIEKEWVMFHNVNGDARAYCQNDRATFDAMRRAQFEAWSTEAAESYLADLVQAESEGRNLAREKYIHMMKSTDPENYEILKQELPTLSDAQIDLTSEILNHLLAQTIGMNRQYPTVALSGRPLLARDEKYGATSIETYQKGELLTYSENTLRALLNHIVDLEQQRICLAILIRENTVKSMGFASLEEAEKQLSSQTQQ